MPITRAIVATGYTFTGAQLSPDSALNAGTLALLEPGHPYNPTAGTAAPTTIPNIGASKALSLVGAGADADWTAEAIGSQANFFFERTAKGGLHGKARALGAVFTTRTNGGWAAKAPAVVNTYLDANRGHSIYTSMVIIPTRAKSTNVASGGDAMVSLMNTGFTNGREMLHSSSSGSPNISVFTGTGGVVGGVDGGNYTVGTPMLASVATTDGTTQTTVARLLAYYTSFTGTTPLSFVSYRHVMEDLTVSGLTYAQARARDLAWMSAQVTTSGGRYFGDTWTAPSTID